MDAARTSRKTAVVHLALAAVLVLNALAYWLRPGGDAVLTVVSDCLPIALSASAVVLLAGAVRAFAVLDRTKMAWALITAGIALFFLGEASYGVQEVILGLDMDELFPSVADLFWMLGYVPLLAGLLVLLTGYLASGFPLGSFAKYLLAALVVLGLGVFLVLALFTQVVADDTIPPLVTFCYLFYPIADFILLAPALILVMITATLGRSMLARPWMLLAAGFVMLAVADIAYSYLDWQGLYFAGHPIDIAWNAAYGLFGLAGLSQARLVRSL